jgi:hypothetical protein
LLVVCASLGPASRKRDRERVLVTYAFDLSSTLACLALHMPKSFLAQLLVLDRPGGAGKVGMVSQSEPKRGVVHEYDADVGVGAKAGECIFAVEDAVVCLKCFEVDLGVGWMKVRCVIAVIANHLRAAEGFYVYIST